MYERRRRRDWKRKVIRWFPLRLRFAFIEWKNRRFLAAVIRNLDTATSEAAKGYREVLIRRYEGMYGPWKGKR